MPLTGSRTVALSVSALALALLPCTRTSHTQAVWHLHLHPAPHPCTVSPGAPPAPAPSPAQHTPHRQRQRHSLDVELGEDDVGYCRRRGTLAPIRSIVGGTVEGTRRSLFPRSLTKRNDAPRYRSLLSQEGSQTCPSMGF